MTRRQRLSLFVLALIAAATAHAEFQAEAMRRKYAVGSTFHLIGYAGVDVRNVDDTPGDEILVGYPSMWHLLQWDSAAGDFSQAGFYENGVGNTFSGGGLREVAFAHLDRASGHQVAALAESGVIGLFTLRGVLSRAWDPALPSAARRMILADLDGREGDEVLLQTCTELTAWQFGAAAPLWRLPLTGCSSIIVAQLDHDDQPEIVLGTGYVIDSSTRAIEWRYPLGFGNAMAAADILGDRDRELIACIGRQCTAFDVLQRTTLWQTFVPYAEDVAVLTAADIDGDGKAELFGGDSQHGWVRRLSGADGAIVAQMPKTGGTNFVAIANLDGDCDVELVWARNGDNTGPDTIHVSDPATMQTLWSSAVEERGSSGIAFADFSGTSTSSILWTSRAGSIVRRVDFAQRAHTVREVSAQYDSYANRLPVTVAAQLDADPASEYVLPVRPTGFQQQQIAVFDGASNDVQWTLTIAPTQDTITSMAAGDLTGDGIAEIILGSSILYFPAYHSDGVVAVDGATRQILWRTTDRLSDVLSNDCSGCIVQVAHRDLDLDGKPEVLALVPTHGLFAFDGKTGARLWHRAAVAGAWGFSTGDIDPSPGVEIIVALYGYGRLLVLDSTGGVTLREKTFPSLGSPLAAQVADLDSDGQAELVAVVDDSLVVLSAATLDILWTGGPVLPWLSLGNQLVIADIDGDATLEIVVPSAHSLQIYEYRSNGPDHGGPTFRGGRLDASKDTNCCGITLRWSPATDAVSMPVRYRVYRSSNLGFTPDGASFLGETSLETYRDRPGANAGTLYYYAVVAVDASNNPSDAPLRVSATLPDTCRARKQRSVRR